MDHRSRNHGRWILGVLVAGQLILLGYQVRRPDAGGIMLLRRWSAEVVLPAEKFSGRVVSGIRNFSGNYLALRQTHSENQQLRLQLSQLELQNQQLRQAVRDLPRLDALLAFHQHYKLQTQPAQVISRGASVDSQAIFLNRGRDQGIKPNMAVITPQGLVGKLSQVFGGASQVLVVTDPDSGVGAVIGAQGIHGILRGLGAGRAEVERILKYEPVKVGDAVVTSGEDQVFPAGVPIGTVTGVQLSADGIFKTAAVRLSADVGRLQDVLVVTAQLPTVLEQPQQGADENLTAADERALRLPGLAAPAAGIGPPGKQERTIEIPTPPPQMPLPAAKVAAKGGHKI